MLAIVALWITVYLSGMLLCKIGGEKETSQLWIHLTGFFFLFFCQGPIFFGGQLLGWSFSQCSCLLATVLFVVDLVGVLLCRREIKAQTEKLRSYIRDGFPRGRYYALTAWLALGLILVISWQTVGNRLDAVVETVQRTLLTDTMNQYHPFTGDLLEQGVILSRKIVTLPFWYAALSRWTGLAAVDTVWVLGSILTTLFSLMAFSELATQLFNHNFGRSWLLVIFLELVYLTGDYATAASGYRQLFYGYAGETIVAAVMLPVVLTTLYRLWGKLLKEDFDENKDGLSWWGALVKLVLCLGASLFLTTAVWGIVMILMAVALFFLCLLIVWLVKKRYREE
jgi:hypothetical protein